MKRDFFFKAYKIKALRIIRVMRIALLLLLAGILYVNANASNSQETMIDSKNSDESAIVVQEGRTITGKVTNTDGEPLPGVTVAIKGTSRGTITDENGNYSLQNVSSGNVLVFSFIGMRTGEVLVSDQTIINFIMSEESIGLEEVVAIGYGSIEKRDLTGSVASVGGEELISVGAISPIKALQANVAGVNISQKTGTVGSDFDIQIRGANSLTGAAPLFVVDSVMTDNINFLNTNDIVRIDILKDASSTAIYGSRGSNGVVIVTTKTGEGIRARRSDVTYSGFVGVRTISNMPDFLNSYDESVQWNKDRQVTRDLVQGNEIVVSPTYGFPTVITEDGTNYWAENLAIRNGTDWVGELIKPSIQHLSLIHISEPTRPY